MPDESRELRRLSDELASDPASLAFVALTEALRRAGELDNALRVALRGLERHAYLADGHDALARVYLDRGELARAADEWETTLQLSDGHLPALKGLGYLAYRSGDLRRAERCLRAASEVDPSDSGTLTALARVREALGTTGAGNSMTPASALATAPLPASPLRSGVDAAAARAVFAPVLQGNERTAALLLDADGLVIAGEFVNAGGRDVSAAVGAELAGVSMEARRALTHLGLGEWNAMHVEAQHATFGMASAPGDSLALLALPCETPAGLVRLLLGRVLDRSRDWLEEVR